MGRRQSALLSMQRRRGVAHVSAIHRSAERREMERGIGKHFSSQVRGCKSEWLQWDAVADPVPQTQRQKKKKKKSSSSLSQRTRAMFLPTLLTHRNRIPPFQRSNGAAGSVSALPPSDSAVTRQCSEKRRKGRGREEGQSRSGRGAGKLTVEQWANSGDCLPQEQSRARGEERRGKRRVQRRLRRARGSAEESAEERGAATRREEWTHITTLRRPHRKPMQRH